MNNKHYNYDDNEPTSVNLPKLAGSKDEPVSPNNKLKKAIVFIAPILIAIMLASIIIFYFTSYAKDKALKKESINESKSLNNNQVSKPCHINRDHIHLADLNEKDQHNLYISTWAGNINLYINSNVKSIVFNGNEYDFNDIVSYLMDYNKMSEFIANNTSFYNAVNIKNGKYHQYIKTDYKASDVASFESFITNKDNTYNSVKYYVVSTDDIVNYQKESDTAKRYIEVSWAFPKKALTKKNELSYIVDSKYYGKSHTSNDRIVFSVDGLRNNKDYDEDFGLILNDGRFVHAINKNEDGWFLTKNIIIENYKVEWEENTI